MARFQETNFLNEQPESKVKHLTVMSCPSCNDEECLGWMTPQADSVTCGIFLDQRLNECPFHCKADS